MSDEPKKPDPVQDLKKGLGLLFRAAKGAVDQLPTDKLEDVVKTGAREVGRAIENVTETIEKEVFGIAKKKESQPPAPAAPSTPPTATATAEAKDETDSKKDEAPKDPAPEGDLPKPGNAE